jgi:hypothetical protein
MGEFATLRSTGADIKIGTCEDLYYLRADQARLIYGGDIASRDWSPYRFRFPFPFEDSIRPGAFEDYAKRLTVWSMRPPAEMADEHYHIQFTSPIGYNLTIRCPESCGDDERGMRLQVDGLVVHRNGFTGAVGLSQQRLIDGQLVPILECSCGLKWRVPLHEADPLIDAIEAEATSRPDSRGFWAEILRRIRLGYDRDYVASLGL